MSVGSPRDVGLPRQPLSRMLNVRRLPDGVLERTIEASAVECAAIADDIGLAAVKSLSARFRVSSRANGNVRLSGDLAADIVQVCVTTLEPFESRIAQPVERSFAPSPPQDPVPRAGGRSRPTPHVQKPVAPVVVDFGDGAEDPPDPIIDDTIDLGAIAVECLCLALDPYPRKPGAHFDDTSRDLDTEPDVSPFAVLGPLKDRL